MIALLARKLALTLFLALLWIGLVEQFNPNPPRLLIVHHADYQRCFTVHNEPLQPRARYVPYRHQRGIA